MIGRLRGRLEYRGQDHVLIDVQGVGYIVFCSDRTLAALPRQGEAVSLFTDMVVREDLMQLYGFPTLMEKEWHRLLCSVQGVGARVSLAILGALGPDGVGRAIALGDAASIKAAKGVGPKTAQRVVLDLKDKAPAVMAMGGLEPVLESMATTAPAIEVAAAEPRGVAGGQVSDVAAQAAALSALSNLGYAPGDAAGAVAEAAADLSEAGEAELIRAALKLLAPKG